MNVAMFFTFLYAGITKTSHRDPENAAKGMGIDLLRCESLLGLEPATCARVLQKNYE